MTALVLATLLGAALSSCFGPATTASPDPSLPGTPSPTPVASPSDSPVPSLTATPSPTPTPSITPGETSQPTATPAATPTPGPTATETAGWLLHRVGAGESLSVIAGRYGTTWQSVLYWNRDRYPTLDPTDPAYDPNRIEIGWELVVWPGVVIAYDPPPPPTPPTPTAGPSPVASTLVTNGSRSSGMVALTFDLGGRTDPAIAIMTWLRDHSVPATIFPTGESVDTSSVARQVIALVNARPDLFDLGNHSYSHPHMAGLSAAQVADELWRADAAIDALAVQPTRPIFRPPFGEWDAEVLAGAGAAGYRWTVMWDVDTIDWKPIAQGGPTAAQIVAKVLGGAQGGSIVLMHLGGYETLSALPGIVDGLRADGYTLVTLDTLLGN